MYRTTPTKISCFVISAISILTTLLATHNFLLNKNIGLHSGCSLFERLLYPFIHANILHLVVNLYIFNLCFFRCNMSIRQMAISFLIAFVVPTSMTNVVGLSGVCFALFGILFAHIKKGNRVTYLAQVFVTILVALIVPHIAWQTHLFCFVIGLILGVIFKKYLQQ